MAGNGYIAGGGEHGWQQCMWLGFEKANTPDNLLAQTIAYRYTLGDIGWKLHISATTKEAQQDLAALVEKHKIHQYKWWPDPAAFQQPSQGGVVNKQFGKTFVVYCAERNTDGESVDWEKFIEEADAVLKKHGAGMPVRGDRKIPGSAGIYYRYDKDDHGNYFSREAGSIEVHEHQLDIKDRYKPIPGIADPFENIRLGDAKHCSPEQIEMFHAVYSGDFDGVLRLYRQQPELASFKDPASGKTMLEIADKLGAYEEFFRAKDRVARENPGQPRVRHFKEIIFLPKILSGECHTDISGRHHFGEAVKCGKGVLWRTNTLKDAQDLGLQFKKLGTFEDPAVSRAKIDGKYGVLVTVDEFETAFPGQYDRLKKTADMKLQPR